MCFILGLTSAKEIRSPKYILISLEILRLIDQIKSGLLTLYNVPIKQDKNFEKLNEPDIIKNSKLSGKKVHKNG
jgi:hypothetical protein